MEYDYGIELMEYEKWPNHNRHNTFNPFFGGFYIGKY